MGVAWRKEWRERWRSRQILMVGLVLLLSGLMSPLLAKLVPELLRTLPQGDMLLQMIPPPSLKDAVGQYLKNVSQFAMLLAILVPMGTVANEIRSGTAAMVLSKPLTPEAFLVSKFAAHVATFGIGGVLAALGGYLYTALLFEAPNPWGWLAMNLLLWLLCATLAAVVLLGSTLTRSSAGAAGFGFGTLMLSLVAAAIPPTTPYAPTTMVGWAGRLALAQGGAEWRALVVALLVIAASLAASVVALRRMEL